MKPLTIVTQVLDYLDLRIKIPKIVCLQRKRSHVKLIAPRANVTPFPVVVAQSDYDAVPLGGMYWFNGQLQKRYWTAPTPNPETPEPFVRLITRRALDVQDTASALTDQLSFKKNPRNDGRVISANNRSPIRRFLIPIDVLEVKPVDLKPILKVAERFDAEVTLLHCYEIPPSFGYAVGPLAPMEVTLHRDMARTRLLKLCTEVRKFFAKCRYVFAVGSLPVEILRASAILHADLIVIALSLDLVSHSWTTREVLDELVRKANCSVLEIPLGPSV